MPTVMNHPDLLLRVHDRHPMLHGLSWLLLCLLLLAAFLLAVMPGAWTLMLTQGCTIPVAQV